MSSSHQQCEHYLWEFLGLKDKKIAEVKHLLFYDFQENRDPKNSREGGVAEDNKGSVLGGQTGCSGGPGGGE